MVGALFVDMVSKWHLSYNGWSLVTNPMGVPLVDYDMSSYDVTCQMQPQYIQGEVIIDFQEAFNH